MSTAEIENESKLTVEQLEKLKFKPFVEHEFVGGCKHSSLQGMSESTNPWGNCVTVYAEKQLAPRSSWRGKVEKYGSDWTKYTVVVCGDKWGETRDEIEMPKGTDLKAAKAKAIEIAKLYIADGKLFI